MKTCRVLETLSLRAPFARFRVSVEMMLPIMTITILKPYKDETVVYSTENAPISDSPEHAEDAVCDAEEDLYHLSNALFLREHELLFRQRLQQMRVIIAVRRRGQRRRSSPHVYALGSRQSRAAEGAVDDGNKNKRSHCAGAN